MKDENYILIVEDDNEWRDIIKSVIKKNFDIKCKSSKNYQNSIKLFRSSLPLAVILDLNLGNNRFDEGQWSGWKLAGLAKEKHIPLIIVTGYPRDDRIALAFKMYKVIDFFDKKYFTNRLPEFIKDIEEVVNKAKKYKNKTSPQINLPDNKVTTKVPSFRKKKHSGNNSVFISYSHKDKNWLEKFTPHLQVLAANSLFTVWDDTMIKAGAEWRKQIDIALDSARAALLLVTPNFLASEFIKKIELPALLDAVEKRGLVIFWVAVEHSMYDVTYISRFQAVNDPSKPLASLSNTRANQEIVKICNKIKDAIQ